MSNATNISRLLVPIHIDALAVGKKLPKSQLFQWTNLAPDFAKLQSDYFFGSELGGGSGNPFDEAAALEPGIHLHFRLPRALTHGSQAGSGDVSFPPIPNRWLVQRFGGSGELTYRAWLIQNDVETEEALPGVTWPTFHKDAPVEFKRIGACTELTEPLAEQDESADPKITAVGPGNPAFSAYYPACRSVLGFYDPMTDVPEDTSLSYLVTGWYSHAEDDPLNTFFAEFPEKPEISSVELTQEEQEQQFAELQAWAKERRLQIGDTPLPFNLPARFLCHGLVRGITWQGPGENYMQISGKGTSTSQPTVFPLNTTSYEKAYKLAVGDTAEEALAALLAPGVVDQDLLTALQGDMLSQPVTAADLQYELHEQRFSGVHGGTIFLIRQEPDQPGANKAAETPKPGSTEPIPRLLREYLRDLNAKQRRCDQLFRRVEDCRWLLYALWYLWTSENKKYDDLDRLKKLEGQLNVAKEALKNERTAWNSAKKDRDDSAVRINGELAQHPKTQPDGSPRLNAKGKPELKFRLALSAAPPFQKPNDPGIAVFGPAMARHNSWLPPDSLPTGSLKCRISGQEVTGIELQVPVGPLVTITGKELMATLFSDWEEFPVLGGIHGNLLGEALLLDEQHAATIAERASQQYQAELTKTVKALQKPTSTAAQSQPPSAPNALIGCLPERTATFDWMGNPWIPLFLVWQVSWQSAYQSPGREAAAGQPLAEELVTGRWKLGNNAGGNMAGDLIPIDIDNEVGSSLEQEYEGYAILTPSASKNLAKRLAALGKSHPLVDVLEHLHVQSQMLDGFNDALKLQKPGMQLPPLDFQAWWDSRGDFKIADIYADLNEGFDSTEQRHTFRTAPRETDDPLLPIRAGRLQIKQISIVDAFGQTLKLPIDQINESAQNDWEQAMLRRAHSCVADSSQPTTDGNIVSLRPRFTQPMRLRFEWATASAGPEKNGGPVCGWILPNHLEKNLTIYSATGKPLGALQKKLGIQSGARARAFYWLDVPGGESGEDPDEQDLSERLAKIIEDRHLRYFCDWVLSLSADDGVTFSAIIDKSMASADQRVPDEDPGVSVLVGRPLALVRANLQFETAGLPAHRPELRPNVASSAATETRVDDLLDTIGFQKVRWPLRLGDLHARNDGLIGVFQCSPAISGEDVITSGPFHPAWGQDVGDAMDRPEAQERIFAGQDFLVDCVQPLQVTMLMDPQARVYATTGALPRTFLELPHEDVTGARRAREVFFQTAPVLGLSAAPHMPKPSDDYGEWSWAYRPDVTHWKLDPTIVEATDRGAFSNTWPAIAEGWLKLAIAPVKILSLWIREGVEEVAAGTRIHLAWSLQGAESLTLEGDGMETVEWNAAPLPREYGVTVQAETTYRITAAAEGGQPSSKELTIKIATR